MDITPFLDWTPAPRAYFELLKTRKDKVRFMVPSTDGGWQPVTWSEFGDTTRWMALYLNSIEFGTGDLGAIYAPNSVAWGAAYLAIQSVSGIMVPVYPGSTAEQAGYVIGHSGASVVFVDTDKLFKTVLEDWSSYSQVRRIVLMSADLNPFEVHKRLEGKVENLPAWNEVEARLISWSEAIALGREIDWAQPNAFDAHLDAMDPDNIGLVLYTSGTSGAPKGVPLTHKNVGINGADWIRNFAPIIDEDMVDILWLPMSHMFGLGEFGLGNTLGFVTYLAEPSNVLDLLPKLKPNVFMSVPAYWEKIAMVIGEDDDPETRCSKVKEATGGNLKLCLSGGAGLKRDVKDLLYSCGVLVIEGYGLTETSPTLTLNSPTDFRFDTVGKPFPSVQLKLADDGEILAKGPNVFKGYYKDPEATEGIFTEDGWLKTGDIGEFTDEGFLRIIDRKKDIIVTAGGKNIPPANIEIRFKDDPYIEHVVVYGDSKKYLVAGVWLNYEAIELWAKENLSRVSDFDKEIEALIRARIDKVNSGLGRVETIKRFRIIDEPLRVENALLTPTMKVRRKKVYERFKQLFEDLYVSEEPANNLLAAITRETGFQQEDLRS